MDHFKFSEHAVGFDDHIDKSIIDYTAFTLDVVKMSRFFIESNTKVIDIGCSTGNLLSRMKEYNLKDNSIDYIGIEPVSEFEIPQDIKIYGKEFGKCLTEYDLSNASLVTSMMTIQFMNTHERQCIFDEVYKCLIPGGAFIFAEKTDMESSKINEILQNLTTESKRNHFSDSEILDKDYGLRNTMHRSTSSNLILRAKRAGFSHVEQIWQKRRFAGFVAIK